MSYTSSETTLKHGFLDVFICGRGERGMPPVRIELINVHQSLAIKPAQQATNYRLIMYHTAPFAILITVAHPSLTRGCNSHHKLCFILGVQYLCPHSPNVLTLSISLSTDRGSSLLSSNKVYRLLFYPRTMLQNPAIQPFYTWTKFIIKSTIIIKCYH